MEALSFNGAYGAFIQALNGIAVHAEGNLGASIGELGTPTAAVNGIATTLSTDTVYGENGSATGQLGTSSAGVIGTAVNNQGVRGVNSGVDSGKDFRCQLSVIDSADSDTFVQAKIVKPIAGNRVTVRTSEPITQVSWQVTGIRKAPYAQAHPIKVEVIKPPAEQDSYLHPELCGQAPDKQLDRMREKALRAASLEPGD